MKYDEFIDAVINNNVQIVQAYVQENQHNPKFNINALSSHREQSYRAFETFHSVVNLFTEDYRFVDKTPARPALIKAVRNQHTEMVEYLLTIPSISENTLDSLGYSALEYAVSSGYTEIVRYLLRSRNIDVNIIGNRFNGPPLVIAARKGYADIVTLLLDFPSVNLTLAHDEIGKWGQTALDTVIAEGHEDLTHHLLHVPGFDIHQALAVASGFGRTETVRYIISQFPDIDINRVSRNCYPGYSPLANAIHQKHTETAIFLMKIPSIDVNQSCGYWGTPLMMAVRNNDGVLVEELLKFPDIDLFFSQGPENLSYTAFDIAREKRNHELFNKLISKCPSGIVLKNIIPENLVRNWLPRVSHPHFSVRKLTLSDTNPDQMNVPKLIEFLEVYSDLGHLNLNQNALGGAGKRWIFNQISDIETLIPSFQALENLQVLELDNAGLDSKDTAALTIMLEKQSHVKKLTFDGPGNSLSLSDRRSLDNAITRSKGRAAALGLPVQPGSEPEWYTKFQALNESNDLHERFNYLCNIVALICADFTPPANISKDIESRLRKSLSITDLEAWQRTAPACEEKANSLRLPLVAEEKNEDENAQHVQRLKQQHTNSIALQEAMTDMFGHNFINNLDNSVPIKNLYDSIGMHLLQVENEMAHIKAAATLHNVMGLTPLECFSVGIGQRLESYYYASRALDSGLLQPNNHLTPESKLLEAGEELVESLIGFSFGMIAFAALAPSSGLPLAAIGITLESLKLIKKGAEAVHLVEIIPGLKNTATHKAIHLIQLIRGQESLNPAVLRHNMHAAFRDYDDFSSFRAWATGYFAQRYREPLEPFDSYEAVSIGTRVGERVAEPFMLGLRPWMQPDRKKDPHNWHSTLEKIGSWVYYSSSLPFLMKRRDALPFFTTRFGEKVSLDSILAPTGFWLLYNGHRVTVEVNPLEVALGESLHKHVGRDLSVKNLFKKSSKTLEKASIRLTGYCMANAREAGIICEQLDAETIDGYVIIQQKNNLKVIQALSKSDSKSKEKYQDSLGMVKDFSSAISNEDGSKKDYYSPFVMKSSYRRLKDTLGPNAKLEPYSFELPINDRSSKEKIELMDMRIVALEEKISGHSADRSAVEISDFSSPSRRHSFFNHGEHTPSEVGVDLSSHNRRQPQ